MRKKKQNAALHSYMNAIIGKLKTDGKYPAVHTYTATLNSLTACSEEQRRGMSIGEVFTVARLKEYQDWLRGRKAAWNTVSTYMRTLKAVYNRAVNDRLTEFTPSLFDDVYTGVESQTKRALTQRQAQTILDTDIETLPPDVQCTYACFALMILLRGMPFIDLAHLRKQDLRGNLIVYCRHKTGRQIVVRITPNAGRLLEKFRQKIPESGYLFPILNDKTKDGKELHKHYLCALRTFNRKLAKLAKILLPEGKLSSYTPRHTWATLAFHRGINIGIISKALGHSSIKVTETYLKPFENEKVDVENEKLIAFILKGKNEVLLSK